MINYNLNLKSYHIRVIPSVTFTDFVQTYKVNYTTNITEYFTTYKVNYTSRIVLDKISKVSLKNTYLYDDNVSRYFIRFSSGREVLDRSMVYRLRYVSENLVDHRLTYKILFSSEVQLLDITQPYKVRYTSWGLTGFTSSYTVRYLSVGVGDLEHRKRWNIKYTSQSLGDFSKTYKIKYTASVFYDNSIRYLIRYSTQGSERVLVRSALIRNEVDGTVDAIFQVRGTMSSQMDSYFYVLSNLPKYQHVEYIIGTDELPYVSYVKYYEAEDIFNTEDNGRYEIKGYLILKDVNPEAAVSLDVYDMIDYKRANRSKSFFFSLGENNWDKVDIDFKDIKIKEINYSSDDYTYNYLNFVSTEITPVFNPGETCCFSRKILPPGSPNISGGCSPF